MFVTKMSNYLFVISFKLMFYETLRYRLARALEEEVKVLRNHAYVWETEIFYLAIYQSMGHSDACCLLY